MCVGQCAWHFRVVVCVCCGVYLVGDGLCEAITYLGTVDMLHCSAVCCFCRFRDFTIVVLYVLLDVDLCFITSYTIPPPQPRHLLCRLTYTHPRVSMHAIPIVRRMTHISYTPIHEASQPPPKRPIHSTQHGSRGKQCTEKARRDAYPNAER